MKRLLIATSLILMTSQVFAQQANPDVQACQSMLFERIQRELDVRSQAFKFSDDLAKAQARIKELESKQEEKK